MLPLRAITKLTGSPAFLSLRKYQDFQEASEEAQVAGSSGWSQHEKNEKRQIYVQMHAREREHWG